MMLSMTPTATLSFKVWRQNTDLIPPAKPTPHEFKPLSDIDDQEAFRLQFPVIQFYRRNPSMEGKDPVQVIREAISKALVFYYPLAGRLREQAARKLVVECTGEGVMFIEADADVTLQHFEDILYPPFPCLEELLYNVPGSAGIINCPLLLIQITRMKCGGFIFALRFNHTMADGRGIAQFMSAVGQLAQGAEVPSPLPVWERHLLNARSPPRVSYTPKEFEDIPDNKRSINIHVQPDDMEIRPFFFGADEISSLRNCLPLHLRGCSTFELLTAYLWRCCTIARSLDPDYEVRTLYAADCRKKFNPPLPDGYYGNAIVSPAAISTAGDLTKNSLHYALDLVRKSKFDVTEEHIKSVADLMVLRGRPHVAAMAHINYVVSDFRYLGFGEVDFGWGKPAYGGAASYYTDTNYIPFKNSNGESGVLAPIRLPVNAMKVFVKELEMLVKRDATMAM